MSFGSISSVVGFLYERDLMLVNNFAVMTAGQVCQEDVITTIVIVIDVGNQKASNAHVQISVPLEIPQTLSQEQMNK